MRHFLKKITHPFLKLALKLWYIKPRKYAYNGIEVLVYPEVFPPHMTLSTEILLDFIKGIDLKGKTVLELGCGSGIVSLFSASKGAKVTASDINTVALEALKVASKKNKLPINIQYSNLFESLPETHFNYIIINPPYYPKQPKSIKEQAWFCGENFEYFENLFFQLSSRLGDENILMILSVDCDIERIKKIAKTNGYSLNVILEKKIFGEQNFIFRIETC